MTKDPKSHAWAVLLTAHATLIERIETALAEAGLPPLGWYDVLWELEKAEGGKLRMYELAHRVVLSRSNLTRLADAPLRSGNPSRGNGGGAGSTRERSAARNSV